MVKDAEENQAADKKRRESVEARNNADGLIYSTEKTMTEHGEALAAEDKTAIEDAIADLKTALEGDDVEAITAKTEALAQAAQKLGEAMYKAQQEEAAAGDMGDMGGDAGRAQAGGDDSNVVDADFEEVDDDLPKDKSA